MTGPALVDDSEETERYLVKLGSGGSELEVHELSRFVIVGFVLQLELVESSSSSRGLVILRRFAASLSARFEQNTRTSSSMLPHALEICWLRAWNPIRPCDFRCKRLRFLFLFGRCQSIGRMTSLYLLGSLGGPV